MLQAWSAVETIIANGSASGTPISYQKYMDYLVKHSKMLEEGAINNTTLKDNIADMYYMESYNPEDSYYNEATDLFAFMGKRGDVDVNQNMLQYSQALRDGKPKPKPKLRSEQQPIRPELQIKGLLWSEILPELRTAWARELL